MGQVNKRVLGDNFMFELKEGLLEPVLDLVKRDRTLDLQIRNDYIDIYYRGGRLLKIKTNKAGSFSFDFDSNYLKETQVDEKIKEQIEKLKQGFLCKSMVDGWLIIVPSIKHCMDLFFGESDRSEREFQQLVVRENNYSGLPRSAPLEAAFSIANKKVSRLSDYYICDIEYKTSENKEIDMIAAFLPGSRCSEKQKGNLAFIEMKYGDKSVNVKNSGLLSSLKYVESLLGTDNKLGEIREEMCENLNQKRELGLLNLSYKLENFNKLKPEFIFLIVNHNPRSKVLENEIFEIKDYLSSSNYSGCFDIKFAVSSFMGYGLFHENMYNPDDFATIFKKQIYAK